MGRKRPNYPPEFKARAIEICLRAIIFGWSVAKFARWSGIPRVTVLTWLQDDLVFDRYKRAMEIKALDIPSRAMDIVEKIIAGDLDAKAGRAVLSHFEFRMMREVKRIYQPEKTVNHKHSLADMSDDEIASRRDELLDRALRERAAKSPDEDSPGPTIN